MLSLASFFFAAMEEAQAINSDLSFIDDGIINIRDSQDVIDAQFGVVELTVHATGTSPERVIMLDDPTKTIVLRAVGSSISDSTITNSIAQMLQYQNEQQDVLRIFSLGQGPTIGGPGGSGGPPPPPPPPFVQPINFTPNDPGPPPAGPPGGGTTGQGSSIFDPPPLPPPPPPPPLVNPDGTTAPTGSGNVLDNDTGGPLTVIHVQDANDSLDVAPNTNSANGTSINGLYGTLTIGSDGTYSYVVNNSNAAVKALAEGESLIDNPFTYTATNGTTTAETTLTIRVLGTNDAPTFISEDPQIVRIETTDATGTPGVLTASGSLFFTDPDLNDAGSSYTATILNLTVSGATGGLPGSATLESYLTELQIIKSAGSSSGELRGQFSAPDSAFDYLSAGESVELKYEVQIADGHGGTDTQFVTVTIQGTEDAPVISLVGADSDAETLIETNDPLSIGGTLTVTDIDLSNTVTAEVTGVTLGGTTGGLSSADVENMLSVTPGPLGADSADAHNLVWTFNSDPHAFDFLADGESLTLTYTVRATDNSFGGALSDEQAITITIQGTNDGPVAVADTNAGDAVTEAGVNPGNTPFAGDDSATGNVLTNDTDV
ncbi:MAG TPA: VCBS domain-containing protein, partial [Pseudolabrys sp.]